MAVESVEIIRVGSGEITEIEYIGPSEGALAKENNGTDLRLNLLNTWGNDVQDITTEPEGGLAEGDTIQVNFTVSDINQMASSGEGEETETPTTAAATTTTTTTTVATDSADSTSDTDSSYLCGDYDGDGSITINDAYNILLAYSNISAGKDSGMTETQEAAVDVDGNGKVDIQDAYKILLYYSYQSAGKTVDWDSL
ncbi:MAG: hypothetical protein LUC50_01375 [Ruminococcus sp.]|nr:hypothetical protein [Ruminococcus sp.]